MKNVTVFIKSDIQSLSHVFVITNPKPQKKVIDKNTMKNIIEKLQSQGINAEICKRVPFSF